LTCNLHKGGQLRKFFTQWNHLHSFYKAGSLIQFSQKSVPLKAIHLHKKRVFNRLKRYWSNKKARKMQVKKFKQERLVALVVRSFRAWKKEKKSMAGVR